MTTMNANQDTAIERHIEPNERAPAQGTAQGTAQEWAQTTSVVRTADRARTLYLRVAADARPVDPRSRARRARLLSHADRAGERRRALAELLRSGALADAVAVDPLLRQDVMRLVSFVYRDDHAD